ncbi:uncharacterized protein [Nicotiana sylvestris]|uniref:uncharacterized protein n=1 Tax=Nicotiana sylvestris TaxID=4096 RepID=UPI00388CD8FE
MKAQALADHLDENLLDEEYEPLKTYFPDEEVMHVDELELVGEPGAKSFDCFGETFRRGKASTRQLYEKLKVVGYVTLIPTATPENPSQWVNPKKSCAYYSGMKGYTIDECRSLKDKIQSLIDNKIIMAKEPSPNVRNNPLPDHKGGGIHMIEIEDDWDHKGSIGLIAEGDDPKKLAVTLNPIIVQFHPSEDAEVNMSVPLEFETIPSAKTSTPIKVEFVSPANAPAPFEVAVLPPKAQVPFEVRIAALIPVAMSAMTPFYIKTAHKNALLKVLSEAYVPSNITGGEMANMVGKVLESYKITFHEDELPPKGLGHNKALHNTVQCEDYFITRILIDGGSSLNICPLRSTIGEISLCLQMRPTWFEVDFQVIDVPISYNLLLGQPWIHSARAVASMLHQAVKFKWNHQEVIIHGDDSNPIYSRQTILAIERRRKLGGESYHHIERLNVVDKDKWWENKIESILNWSGYEPGKGLGKNLQGISKPTKLKTHGTTFGLGYDYIWEEFNNWSPPWRGPYYPLEQPIPHLEQTFQLVDIIYGSDEEEALVVVKNLFLGDDDMDFCVILEEEGEEVPSI